MTPEQKRAALGAFHRFARELRIGRERTAAAPSTGRVRIDGEAAWTTRGDTVHVYSARTREGVTLARPWQLVLDALSAREHFDQEDLATLLGDAAVAQIVFDQLNRLELTVPE